MSEEPPQAPPQALPLPPEHDGAWEELGQGDKDLLENKPIDGVTVIPDEEEHAGIPSLASPALAGATAAEQAIYAESYQRARRVVGIIDAEAERKKAEEKLRWAQTHDSLTELLNLRGVTEALNKRIATWPGRSFGVIFLDLDKFKPINDKEGHEEGDKTLKEVARKLRKVLREENGGGDIVAHPGIPHREQMDDDAARTGGDEFVAVIDLRPHPPKKGMPPDTRKFSPLERLRVVENKLTEAIYDLAAESKVLRKYPGFGVTAGGSVWMEGMTAEELLRDADHQMLANKPEDSR